MTKKYFSSIATVTKFYTDCDYGDGKTQLFALMLDYQEVVPILHQLMFPPAEVAAGGPGLNSVFLVVALSHIGVFCSL